MIFSSWKTKRGFPDLFDLRLRVTSWACLFAFSLNSSSIKTPNYFSLIDQCLLQFEEAS